MAVAWLATFVVWAVIWVWVFLADEPAVWITERDLELMRPIVENRRGWLTPPMEWTNRIGSDWAVPIVGWSAIVIGLATKRIRHVLLLIASLATVAAISTIVGAEILRPRPLGFTQIGEWEGFAQPSRPVALLTTGLVAALLTTTPTGRLRRIGIALIACLLVVFGFAQLYVGVDHPTDVLAGVNVGVAITLLLYRLVAPETVFPIHYRGGNTAHLDVTGRRGEAIRRALLDQLGVEVADIEPVGLEGSAGSTPLKITRSDGTALFAKLYARSHLRSDRSYKLGRTLLYGRLEDEQHFTSVRRLIQHEDYMLRVMAAAGIEAMSPLGIVEITPEHEYLLVTEFLDGAVEIDKAEMSDELIDASLQAICAMWTAGLAHRDIKPANVMVRGSEVHLIDVAFGQVRPSPWRQAVDLANMMLVLALTSSPETVYERARRHFSEDEIAEAFAASRGVTLPSQLRADVRQDGRELVERFRSLAPERSPVAIQRWTVRRLALTLWVAFVAAALAAVFLGNVGDIGLL